MADRWGTNKVSNLSPVLGRINRLKSMYREIGVQSGCKDTSGYLWRSQGKDNPRTKEPDLRTNAKNTIILRWHARGGGKPKRLASGEKAKNKKGKQIYQHVPKRDVAFFSTDEIRDGNKIWQQGIVKILDKALASQELERRAKELGEFMIATYRKHIDKRQGRDGTIKEVMPGTQKAKEREVGPQARGLPPLKRTGQLYRSFIYGIKRYK